MEFEGRSNRAIGFAMTEHTIRTRRRATLYAICAASSVVALASLYIASRIHSRVVALQSSIKALKEASQKAVSFDRQYPQYPRLGRIRSTATSEVGAGLRRVIMTLRAEQAAWLWSGIPAGSGPARVVFINGPNGEELRFILDGGRIEFNKTVIPLTTMQHQAIGALTSRPEVSPPIRGN